MSKHRGYGFKRNSKGALYTPEFLLEVARGLIPGHTIINKFAYNPDIDNGGTTEDVWAGGGLYKFYPTTAKSMRANSTNAEDIGSSVTSGEATAGSFTTIQDTLADFVLDGVTAGDVVINDTTGEFGIVTNVTTNVLTHTIMSNASQMQPRSTSNSTGHNYRVAANAGDGAGVVHFIGLDSDWDVQTETIILDGLTFAPLQKQYMRQHRAAVIIATDDDLANLGDISCSDVADATSVGTFILTCDGQTEQSSISIPRAKTGHFLQGYVGMARTGPPVSVTSAQFIWRAKTFGSPFATQGRISCINTGAGWWQYAYKGAPTLPAMSDVKITCTEVSDDDTSVVGGIDLLLIDDGAS